MRLVSRPSFLASLGATIAALTVPVRAQSQSPSVTIAHQPVTFDAPPVVRNGRVFVPLRGVFERLGASVVYDAGRISATRDTITVSLQVGSTGALVNDRPAELEDPPFIADRRVFVPLRFVSTALGVRVRYDAAANSVAITIEQPIGARRYALGRRGGGGGMIDLQPPNGGTAGTDLAAVRGTFATDVRHHDVIVRFDGTDVTQQTQRSGRELVYPLTGPLAPGLHNVAVEAVSVDGQPIHTTWSFNVR